MRAGDKAALMDLLRSTPEFKAAELTVAEEVLDSYLATGPSSGYRIIVAENAGTLVGYVCFGETPLTDGTWDMYWIAVAPTYKGQGIGTRMVRFAENAIRRRGGRMLLVETSTTAGYAATRRFYERQGYCRVGDIPDFYAPGDGRIIYQKLLRRTPAQRGC
jgi:ribosomal protein S18 acetylase RimI-like enzyme